MNTTTEKSHSEEQAEAQLAGIKEMLRAMNKETAAEDYARDVSRERCVALLTEASIECYDDETLEVLREALAVNIADDTIEPDDFEFDEDEARQTIQEDPLSVEVRSGWYAPSSYDDARVDKSPAEYCILLCTGGPAVRIIGDLSEHGEPESARLQHQDWGTPWQELIVNSEDRDALIQYAQQFYFGE